MKSLNSIYAENYSEVYSYVNWKLRNVHNAEEVTNDVFLRVNKYLKNFDSEKSSFKTWLRTLTNTTIIDFVRTNHSDKYINVSDFADSETGKEVFQFTAKNDASAKIENEELKKSIMKGFRSLKSNYRQIAVLFFIKDKQYDEIAEICDIPIGSVKGMIHRIREKLQAELKQQYAEI